MTTSQRWFDATTAFEDRVIVIAVGLILAALMLAPVLTLALRKWVGLSEKTAKDILIRTASWAVIVPLVIGPILLGAFWAMLMVLVLGLLGYLEFARITGLFRDRLVSCSVILGIFAVGFAVLDHWYGLFVTIAPLGVITIAAAGVLSDRPKGYVQRVALGVLGFLLFAVCLGHLGYLGNSTVYRPLMILLLLVVSLNDIYAYITGKLFGKRKLCPNTSPNKTIAGALGAVLLTTLTVVGLGAMLLDFAENMRWPHLILFGIMISVCGQLGDLVLSSIKRDIGLKDTGTLLPGHGGVLDRLDSLLLTAPTVFHFIGYFEGVGLDQTTRIFTGG